MSTKAYAAHHAARPPSRCSAFAGSGIGGIAETQEMLDFCAEHGIV